MFTKAINYIKRQSSYLVDEKTQKTNDIEQIQSISKINKEYLCQEFDKLLNKYNDVNNVFNINFYEQYMKPIILDNFFNNEIQDLLIDDRCLYKTTWLYMKDTINRNEIDESF